MELRILDRAELRRVYKNHIKQDFPPAERKPLFVMEKLAREGKYDTLGAYEGADLLAYAFLWHDQRRDYVLLDYLAVCAEGRGRGVGTAVLALLKEHYGDYGGVLVETEAPDPGASPEENALRARRQSFYLRAGFQKLNYQAKLYTVVYDMFTAGAPDRAGAVEAHRRLYCGDRYRPGKWVEIPYETS